MEAAFNKLQKEGKNDVDNVLKWLKEVKIIKSEKQDEDMAKKLLNEAADNGKINLAKFKEVVNKIATHTKVDINSVLGNVQSGAKNIVNNLTAALK